MIYGFGKTPCRQSYAIFGFVGFRRVPLLSLASAFLLLSSAAHGAGCDTDLLTSEKFECNIVQASELPDGTKITKHNDSINGKIGKINDDTITFEPNSGFTGKQNIQVTVEKPGDNAEQRNWQLTYSTAKQNLLAPGQVAALGTLLLHLLFLSIVLEFALRNIFRWRWFIIPFEGRGFKFIVAFGIALLLVKAVSIDIVAGFSSILGKDGQNGGRLGSILTALVIAGGSATVFQIWKMFPLLPKLPVAKTPVKSKTFSRIEIVVDRSPLPGSDANHKNSTLKDEPLEVYIDGDLVGAIKPGVDQFPPINFLWSGHPVEAKEHTYEVVLRHGTANELRWRRRHGVPHLNIKSAVLYFRLDPKDVTFIQSSDIITLIAPVALAAGDPFSVGSIVAIAVSDAQAGIAVKGHLTGVFEVPKEPGSEISQGDSLCWNNTGRRFEKMDIGKIVAGVAIEPAAKDDKSVQMRLTG